jgi:acyl transferase domain-containing protein
MAAVHSYGNGGTHAHVVVSRAESVASEARTPLAPLVCAPSASDPAALQSLAKALATCAAQADPADLCAAWNCGRAALPWTAWVVATDRQGLIDALLRVAAGEGLFERPAPPPVVLVGTLEPTDALPGRRQDDLGRALPSGSVGPTVTLDLSQWSTAGRWLTDLERAHRSGVLIAWEHLDRPRTRVELPHYPWQRTHLALAGPVQPSAMAAMPESVDLQSLLLAEASALLGVALDDPAIPLAELGFTSIMAVQLANVSSAAGHPLPLHAVLGGPSVHTLVAASGREDQPPIAEAWMPANLMLSHAIAALAGMAAGGAGWALLQRVLGP